MRTESIWSVRDLWYKQAVLYGVDVQRFADGNGDGVGDFEGLANRLDYLASLGVTCLWLLPFFESSDQDNGYDVTDYYTVDHRYGSLGDFVSFIHRAEQSGLRVIIDLVVNHTSIEHPWFQQARSDPASPYRDYYVWSETKPENPAPEVMFPGVQQANWTYDDQAAAYYQHKFYESQPDLNLRNPQVRMEIEKIMGFWLELGISGFRVDAAPHLVELPDPKSGGREQEAYWFFDEMHRFVSWRRAQVILLAEANVGPELVPEYFAGGDRMQLLFNFILNPQLALGLVRGEAAPIREALRQTALDSPRAQWVQFLRNQDELDLRRLTDQERQEVYDAWAPEEEMRIYGRGIRRRLASMLGGDRKRIELAYSLLFTLPGSPLLIYGDEIGMGEDLSLAERNSVRTAMQWSPGQHGGFTSAECPEVPVLDAGPFRYELVNVTEQEADADSLLSWMTSLIRLRRRHVELALGEQELLEIDDDAVLATRNRWEDNDLVVLHNLAGEGRQVALDRSIGPLVDVFTNRRQHERLEPGALIELAPYGYRWLKVRKD